MSDPERAANSSGSETERRLPRIFEALVRMIEQQADGDLLASILLVDEEGKRLRHAAAPSLPDAYHRAIDGLPIGPCVGSCGTAAYRGESVYVSDIATDPLWADYKELALAHGLQACWSTPIFSRRGKLLGTFAMYYPQPREPSEHDLRLVDVVTRTVAIAVERDEAERALRQREQSLHVALANSQTGTFRWDPATGVYFEFDENLKRLFGLDPSASVRVLEDLAHCIHPDDTPALLEAIERRRNGAQFEMEFRVLLPGGRIRWLYDRAKLEHSPDGGASYVVGACTDITKRKRAEEESARLAAIVESSGDAIISNDLNSMITSWNRGAERIFGYTAEEAIGQSIALLIPDGHFDESPQILERIRQGESIDHYETVRRRKDGELIDISLTVSPLADGHGRIIGASKIARNVTDRRAAQRLQAEQSLLLEMIASGRPLDDCLQALTAAVSRLQPHTRACVLLADDSRVAFRHLCAADLPPSFTDAVVGAPICERAIGTCGEAVYAGHPVTAVDIARDERWSPEWRELCISHGIRACHSQPVTGPDGRSVASVMLCFDRPHEPNEWDRRLALFAAHVASIVIERDRTTTALRSSEERLRAIISQVHGGIAMTDLDGRFQFVNQRYCQIVGRPAAELLGMRMQEITHADDLQRNLAVFRELRQGGVAYSIEKRYLRPDGAPVWVQVNVGCVSDDQGQPKYALAAVMDIEPSKRLVAELREADRRKDEFLATLAHELRNPLAPIRNSLEILRLSGSAEPAAQRIHEMMDRQVTHMVRLVDDLLEVSRITRGKIELRLERVELAAVVRSAVEASQPVIDAAGHHLAIALPPEPITLRADSVRLAQVLTNLLNNAAKYTPRGGQIELVASVECRVASDQNTGDADDERDTLSGFEGMASCDGPGGAVLLGHENFPQGGVVRDDQSDSPSSGVNTGQHRRRTGEAAHQGVSEPPKHGARLADGVGNPSSTESESRNLVTTNDGSIAGANRPHQPHALRASAGAGSEALTPATHHPPPAAPHLVIRVRDNGIGIPAAMLPRVFEMFAQVNRSLKRAEGGLGIGLALARGLAELHGGTIEAHSAGEGLGSEFIVRLPLAVEPAAQWRVDGPGEPLTLDRRRILVVDDNRDAADTLAMLLKLLGADVQTVYDGASALEAMRAVRPAAVLLDLGMPAMDGYEVARRIRAEPELRDVFLIALTGWGQEDDRRRSQDAGFNVHLVKPVDHLALRTLLADLPPAPASGQQHASLRR